MLISGYIPQSNGAIERRHRDVLIQLTALVNDTQRDWDKHIASVELLLRTAPITGTSFSPFELLYGRRARFPIDIIFSSGQTINEVTAASVFSCLPDLEPRTRDSCNNTNANRLV